MNPKSCSHDRSEVVLFYYGELEDARMADIEARLSVCPACREVFQGMRDLEGAVPRQPTVAMDDSVMSSIRRSTSARLAEAAAQTRAPVRARAFWQELLARPVPALAVAALIAFVSFGAGLFTAGTGFDTAIETDADVMSISGIRFDDERGVVAIRYSTVEEMETEGSLTDPRIQSLLGRALLETENPVTRLKVANIVGDIEVNGVLPDEELTRSLAAVLADERNEGIRLQVIQAVSRLYPRLPLPEYMVEVLTDILKTADNSALRIQALNLLTASEIASMEFASILQDVSNDRNSFIRQEARKRLDALGETVPLEQIQ